jgi:hypothetical protein
VKKQTKKRIIFVVFPLIVIGLSVFLVVWGGFLASKPQAFMPHYLAHKGEDSRIYVASQTTSYGYTEKDYISSDDQTVAVGSGVFTINLTLLNNYSSDNPPPTSGTPVSPIDGTAYIRLKAALFENGVSIPTINVSPSDFATPVDQVGFVLASGQTVNVQLSLATNQTNITEYAVTLEFVSDSIPR